MADDDYGAPQGGGGLNLSNPWVKWGGLAGLVVVAYFVWRHYQNAGAAANAPGVAATGSNTPGIDPNTGLPMQSFAIDPTSGLPINPTTGFDFGTVGGPADINQWTASAIKNLIGQGLDPTNVEQAIYRYVNGQTLTTAQQNIIDKALTTSGAPPGAVLPILPQPKDVVTKTVTTKPPSIMQQFVNSVYAYLHRSANYKGPKFSAAQIALARQDVLSGKAALPAGFKAPAGYVLNPTTRILTPVKKAA